MPTDKERLDFVVRHRCKVYPIDDKTYICENWKYRRDHVSELGTGPRQAIDAAMKAERTRKKEEGR